ncbi:MAG: hypothetical protein WC867_01620 [Candidatus Pacearchaeota archaeon]|jgi:hypothetical protein
MVKREIIAVVFLALVSLALVFGNITGRVVICDDNNCFDKDTSQTIVTNEKCFDSDNGLSFFQKGKIKRESTYNSIRIKESFKTFEDECLNDKILEEYYCSEEINGINSYEKINRYSCPEGCMDGKCNVLESENPKKISIFDKLRLFFAK